jgi:regulator of protease activity HflC (stomatin/prohibitin superfamily)
MRSMFDTPTAAAGRFSQVQWFKGGLALVILIFVIYSAMNLFEHVDANEVMVIQSPLGSLSIYTDAGIKWQGFGKVTYYQKRSQFSFSAKRNQGAEADESLPVMFNDGGAARISGVISWEMPISREKVVRLHQLYGSQQAVEQQLIRPAVERAIYLTGPLMSSAEAYSARKPDLLRYFEDQARNGVYQMETISQKQPDPITGVEKTVQVVQVAMDEKGLPRRQSTSQISEFGIVLLSPAIDSVEFEEKVKAQIGQQQANYMQIQTAKSQALQAEQAAITAQKNGEAEAAKAKWAQEVEKATAVTAAEKERDVAKLGVQTAELTKQRQILEGQGEAEKRKLVMAADGALDKKLAAYVETQKIWADAFSKHQSPLVPTVVMGGGSGNGVASNAATQFMDMLSVRAAKELALDLQATGTGQTKR